MQTVYNTAFATLQFSTLTSTCAGEEKIRKRGITRGERQQKTVRRNRYLGERRAIKDHDNGQKEGKGKEVQMKSLWH